MKRLIVVVLFLASAAWSQTQPVRELYRVHFFKAAPGKLPDLLEAYRHGIFPMPIKVERRRLIAWLSPDPRGIIEFGGLHVSRRLARRLRRGEFQFTLDRAFAAVVEGCAAPRGRARRVAALPRA